jgi:hypothetical protein
MIARAGRVGKLAKAEAIVSEDTARILVDYTIHPERYNLEALNITSVIKLLQCEKQEAVDAEISRLEKEMDEESNGLVSKSMDSVFVTFNEFAADTESTPKPSVSMAKTVVKKQPPMEKVLDTVLDAVSDSWETNEFADADEVMVNQAPPLCTSSDGINIGRTSPPLVPISQIIERTAKKPDDGSRIRVRKDGVQWSEPRNQRSDQQTDQNSSQQSSWRRQTPSSNVVSKVEPRVESKVESKYPGEEKRETKYVSPALRQRLEPRSDTREIGTHRPRDGQYNGPQDGPRNGPQDGQRRWEGNKSSGVVDSSRSWRK